LRPRSDPVVARLLDRAPSIRWQRTDAVIKPIFTCLSFPPRRHHDILRGLAHSRAVGAHRDERPGRTLFELERIKAASRWNTLRALRVLRWWDGADGTGEATCS
jgi:hypothetical protein